MLPVPAPLSSILALLVLRYDSIDASVSSLALRARRPGLRRLPVRRQAAGLRGGRPRPRAAPTVLRRRRRLVSVSALCTKETRIELILCGMFVLFGAIDVWLGVTGTEGTGVWS